ncbi:MAG: 16S rRNA (adenine(1518)-N(6)/adenine(1519)-N(6))-dimethyltransferase RsmA [Gammaproteobacteria bacterium]|nr:16S rRNA (adenine(1518)-N(6)/adenine(1519)-N(6))-dimethyltransferase RsmA [Gammaproteobacteria bacterium]MYK27358.1 16S rRNA (adenine(1518)-N(6)/adenine(1519)-N(6))-dimethyltransferase RsmA [Gammaproteobacteria bacterium]
MTRSGHQPSRGQGAWQPRKRFGQHFLIDEGVLARLVDCLGLGPEDALLEIGPGRGALTRCLHGSVDRYTAVEIDRDLIPGLRSRFPGIELVNADALAFDFNAHCQGRHWRLVGNLPYNIASALLFKLIACTAHIQDMHFMLQREVAERLAAEPGTKARGRLSVGIQHRFAVETLFDVPPQSFAPPPKVFSTVVRLTPHPASAQSAAPEQLEAVVRLAFASRRKRLGNALKPLRLDWAALGIDERLRPADLSVAEFVTIANAVAGD